MDAVGVTIAVGATIAQTQEAWSRGCLTGALLMDVAANFQRMPASKDAGHGH